MTRRTKIACAILAAVLVLAVVALAVASVLYFDIATAEDAEEADAVLLYLRSQYAFPAATYHRPGSSQTTLFIYGVAAPKEQDRIADLLRTVKDTRGWKPVELRFYEKQVLEDLGNGLTQRGRENRLRTITID
ncbi:MAG: hypothetical protein ACYTG3_03110 [Planctomycetota bacterium]|jgi:hypothetical protein